MNQREKPRDIKERTFLFALEVVRLCQRLEKQSDVHRTLGRQLLRSGTSIGANTEEAQAGQSRADFISKYSIALKETRETIYWLRLLRESGLETQDSFSEMIQEADEISKIIGSIIVNTKKGKTKTTISFFSSLLLLFYFFLYPFSFHPEDDNGSMV